ncbi:MAG: serine/threonine-protein kinase [Planctomycetota bacterium]|nr:serine/threonine-protein kinase [Planctomycetota bacterium]
MRIDDQVDDLRKQFDGAWRSGFQPNLADYLARSPKHLREGLFQQLLEVELEYRAKAGRAVDSGEYQRQYPEYADAVSRGFDNYRRHMAHQASVAVGGGETQVWNSNGVYGAAPSPAVPSSAGASPGQHPPESTFIEFPEFERRTEPQRGELSGRHPELINRFQVIKKLGAGNFGSVYLAHDSKLNRQVAIKVAELPEDASPLECERRLQMLKGEAKKVASLDDGGIVPVYEIDEWNGRPYVVSKYIDGCNLSEYLALNSLTHHQIVEIVERVARAVNHAHAKAVVHQDLKPANILIDRQGQPHITDFGLAIHQTERRAMKGRRAGSPQYMSPEQVRAETHKIDGRTDVWSLGVMLYGMLAGRLPFDEKSTSEVFAAIMDHQIVPPRQFNDAIDENLQDIVMKCLQEDINDRYSTANDLADALQKWRTAGTGSNAWKWVIPSVAVVMLTVLGWWLNSDPPPQPPPAPPTSDPNVTLDVTRAFFSPTNGERVSQTFSEATDEFSIELGNDVQIKAKLDRPAYVYVLWIEADGSVTPMYPWQNFKWDQRPADKLVTEITLPDDRSGWEVGGPPGIETIVLFARDEPLPRDFHAEQELGKFPSIPLPETLKRRGPRNPDQPRPLRVIDDATRQRVFEDSLRSEFPYIKSISFPNLGTTQLE